MDRHAANRPEQHTAEREGAALPLIAAVARNEHVRGRIAAAVGGLGELRFCERWEELVPLVQRREEAGARPVTLVVVELQHGEEGSACASVVRAIRAAAPAVPVVGYCRLGARTARDVVEAARAGLSRVVLWGYDDVRRAVRAADRGPPSPPDE